MTTKPAEAKEVENPVNASTGSGDVVTEKLEETSAAPVEGSTEAPPPAAEESTEANPVTGNSGEDAAEENSGDSEETPEIKVTLLNIFIMNSICAPSCSLCVLGTHFCILDCFNNIE